MRAIQKKREPNELTEYRLKQNTDYKNAPIKNICKQLLVEQGYLCAYCMRRITDSFDASGSKLMQVEHWHCQKNYPDEQLDYKNMLGVCSDKTPTCDTHKKYFDLKYNPSNPVHRIESQIKYASNGNISSDDQEFDQQLNKVLNLNYDYLKENRKSIVSAIEQVLSQRPGSRTVKDIEKILERWRIPNTEGQLKEYSGVAVYFLTKRLNRASRNN